MHGNPEEGKRMRKTLLPALLAALLALAGVACEAEPGVDDPLIDDEPPLEEPLDDDFDDEGDV
jgi:hypothetical protein